MFKKILKHLIKSALVVGMILSVVPVKTYAAESGKSTVIEIVPGIPQKTISGSTYIYQFKNLEIAAPEGTLIKNVVVQFTSAVGSGDQITAPTDAKFSILSDSTTANQSINCTNDNGYTVEQWQEYLRKVTVRLGTNAKKTLRFMANTEQKAESIYDYNATNKHYYQLVIKTKADFIDGKAPKFSDAYQAIEVDHKYQYMGQIGYMATVTNEQEMNFVSSVIKNGDNVWLGATAASPYIDEYYKRDGYSTNPNSASVGLFYWISGPEKGQIMWKGSRSSVSNNTSGYYTKWYKSPMEWGYLSQPPILDNFDGLYVATFPTKATYWVWCNQPEDVDGVGYQQHINNWMIEYDGISEAATAEHAVKDYYLDPTLETISVIANNITYGAKPDITVTNAQNNVVNTGLKYVYYQQDESGQYTIQLDGAPSNAGNYKVIVSGDKYTQAEDTFTIFPKEINVTVLGNQMAGSLELKEGEKLNTVENSHKFLDENLVSGDTSEIFGNPVYTWYDKDGNEVNPNETDLKNGDVYTLKVSFPNPSNATKAANYTIVYQTFTLNVIKDSSGNSGTGDNTGGNSGTGDNTGGNSGTGDNTGGNSGTGDNTGGNSGTGDNTGGNSGTGDNTGGNSGTGDNTGGNSGTGDNTGGNSGTGDNTGGNSGTGDNTGGNNGTGDNTGGNNGAGDNTGGNNGTGGNTGGNNGAGDNTGKNNENVGNTGTNSGISGNGSDKNNVEIIKAREENNSSDKTTNVQNTSAPKTGEANMMEFWLFLLLGSFIEGNILLRKYKKKKINSL